MSTISNFSFKSLLTKLVNRNSLTSDEAEYALSEIFQGSVDNAVIGALLSLMRAKGESPAEIAGMVNAMYKVCNTVNIPGSKLLDIVGTGGDGADTINISTASAILAASCGCKVAKFGNRSVSSRCGSADVLETLGISIDLTPSEVDQCIDKCGIGFMFAPIHHPAVKVVAPVRKALGIRTAFNILGPLTNPAKAQYVVIGVFEESLLELVANALIEIGNIEHGVVIHGCGLDEISPLGPSTIIEISKDPSTSKFITNRFKFDPFDEGIARCSIDELKGGDPDENAQELRDVLLSGDHINAKRNAVILNAGVGLFVYGKVHSIRDGLNLARESLFSGMASIKLQKWIDTVAEIRNSRPSK